MRGQDTVLNSGSPSHFRTRVAIALAELHIWSLIQCVFYKVVTETFCWQASKTLNFYLYSTKYVCFTKKAQNTDSKYSWRYVTRNPEFLSPSHFHFPPMAGTRHHPHRRPPRLPPPHLLHLSMSILSLSFCVCVSWGLLALLAERNNIKQQPGSSFGKHLTRWSFISTLLGSSLHILLYFCTLRYAPCWLSVSSHTLSPIRDFTKCFLHQSVLSACLTGLLCTVMSWIHLLHLGFELLGFLRQPSLLILSLYV